MRYIKYDGKIPNLETIQRNGRLQTAAVQRQLRKAKLLNILGTVVFWLLFVILGGTLAFLVTWIVPDEEGVVGVILNFVGKGILSGFGFILAAIVAAVAASPLWGKRQITEKALLREALSNACGELRKFYQMHEPICVTKCYTSSDRRFDRHDVCIFVVDNELRITANLHYGFFDPKRDLGCYALTQQEITLTDTQYKDRATVELRAEDVTFVLASKARAFIEKEFLHKNAFH